jgi:toxin-antitoxin system PIN domain toxin
VKYLLDINALIALAHRAHVHHGRVAAWYQSVQESATGFCTCAITELGFVRVAVQTSLQLDVAAARKALAELKKSSRVPFALLADSLGVDQLPAFARTPGKLTDGHLFELARSHGAEFVTLDTGVPGALLVP